MEQEVPVGKIQVVSNSLFSSFVVVFGIYIFRVQFFCFIISLQIF